jgi:excisionase family DNA binding protein
MTESSQTSPAAVLTVEEAAQILRISRQSAYQAARSGELPTIRIGRRMLVPVARLDELLGQHLTTSESPAGQPGSRDSSGVSVAGHVSAEG